jgi:hypothetical protein
LEKRWKRFAVDRLLKKIGRICGVKRGVEDFWYEICFFFSEDNKQEEKK